MTIHPIILCGGSGTRLWPLSREHYPKPLLRLRDGFSLLQATVRRLESLGAAPPYVVCNEEHRFLAAEHVRELGVTPAAILLEPVGRNTAPALTAAALSVLGQGDGLLLVLPADHVLPDHAAFQRAVAAARHWAEQDSVVTFGITPPGPETGYGYIRRGAALAGEGPVHAVAAFVEKPDAATAQTYFRAGTYYWNSGMFLVRAGLWLDEIERYAPDILCAGLTAVAAAAADADFTRLDTTTFTACRADSIDYAVMERTARAAVVALPAAWSDVGSFTALAELLPADELGNAVQGDTLLLRARNNLVWAEQRLVAALGVSDLVIVETADAVLVAHKDQAQQVRLVSAALASQNRAEHKQHRKVHRPWGSYESVDHGARFQVKRLTV